MAGKVAKCPRCGAKLRIPTPKTKPRAVAAATEPSAPSEPSGGGLPFDEDDWNEAFNPFQSPVAEEKKPKLHDYSEKKKTSRKQLRFAKWGLMMVNVGLNALALCVLIGLASSIFVGVQAAQVAANGGANGGAAAAAPAALGVVGILLLMLYVLGGSLIFLGPYFCVTVPKDTGAKQPAIVAAIAQSALVLLLAVLRAGAGSSSPTDILVVIMMSLIAGVTSYFSFLHFMVKLAKHIRRDDIAAATSMVITLGVVDAICTVCLLALPPLALSFPDLAWIFGILAWGIGLTLLICGLMAVWMYSGTIHKLSMAV